MQIKIKKYYIIHIILLFIVFLLTGCKKTLEEDKKINYNTDSSIKPEPTIEKDVIVFSDFVIESETRKILNKPTGDITKEDVLNITDFSIEGIYDDFDEDDYKPKKKDYFVTTFHKKIRNDMPKFSFNLYAYFNKKTNGYSVEKITISNTDNGKIIQEISIPELTLFGQTNISVYKKKKMGFQLEDLNFDGYKDIRLFDTNNGNYKQEWIYFVWNPDKFIFENDKRLREISMASFDQKKKLIYGMERGSAADHYYSTYKYIDGEPTLIKYYIQEVFHKSNKRIKKYLSMASIETNITKFESFHEIVLKRGDKTGEMKTTRDEYVFYPYSKDGVLDSDKIIGRIKFSSKIGQLIYNENS